MIDFNMNVNFNIKRNIFKSNFLIAFLATKNKTKKKKKIVKQYAIKINTQKYATLLNKIFNYIYITLYYQIFL